VSNAPPPPAWSNGPAVAIEAARPGGFWIRFVAYLIDGLIMTAAGAVLFLVFVVTVAFSGDGFDRDEPSPFAIFAIAVLIVALIVVNWLYEALMTSSPRGATVGKMALGLRIVRFDGAQLSFGRATGRHFAKHMLTPLVPLFIGYLLAAFTNRKRALHDMVADTRVIRPL
jgi:uncharacterized RDD family membrane protein YckC